jgi:hypothetical protein
MKPFLPGAGVRIATSRPSRMRRLMVRVVTPIRVAACPGVSIV